MCKATDRDALAQIVPAIKIGQLGDDGLQGKTMQRITRLLDGGIGCSWRGVVVNVFHAAIVSAKRFVARVRAFNAQCLSSQAGQERLSVYSEP